MNKRKKMNKKGFAMGLGFVVGILVAVISLIFSMAMTPIISQSFGLSRGSNAANCPGFVDKQAQYTGANNLSYNPAYPSDSLTCMVTDFGPGMIILSIVFGIIAGILSGSFAQQEQPQPNYSNYGQY